MITKVYNNPRYPHLVCVSRHIQDTDPFSGREESIDILYKGVGRNYTDTTTTGDTKMDTSRRKVVIPVRFDEWTAETIIHDGDIMTVLMGEIFESGIIKDFEPDNERTVIYWEYGKE